jgi:tyrosyl-DNA phosphodiesterase-1
LQELYRSFCGFPAYIRNGNPIALLRKKEIPPIEIIYPTKETVECSRLGPPVTAFY